MDISGLSQFLLSLGPPGGIILYLLWERRDLQDRLHKCQEARMADLSSISAEMKAAFATSTEVLRANTAIQERAADSAAKLAEAVRSFQAAIEHMEEMIERMQREGRA